MRTLAVSGPRRWHPDYESSNLKSNESKDHHFHKPWKRIAHKNWIRKQVFSRWLHKGPLQQKCNERKTPEQEETARSTRGGTHRRNINQKLNGETNHHRLAESSTLQPCAALQTKASALSSLDARSRNRVLSDVKSDESWPHLKPVHNRIDLRLIG